MSHYAIFSSINGCYFTGRGSNTKKMGSLTNNEYPSASTVQQTKAAHFLGNNASESFVGTCLQEALIFDSFTDSLRGEAIAQKVSITD